MNVVPNFPIPNTVLVHVSVVLVHVNVVLAPSAVHDRVRALPNANGVQVLIKLEGIMTTFLSLQEKMRVNLLCTHC